MFDAYDTCEQRGFAVNGFLTGAVAMRWLTCAALAALIAGPASAGTAERDKAWDTLIAEAKKHGGQETQYKTSVSYVFHRTHGGFLTFTRMVDTPTRAVCVLNEDQIITVCGNWDTEKLRYGWRPDAGSPWTYSDAPPSEPTKDAFSVLSGVLGDFMSYGMKYSFHRRSEWD